MNEDQQKKLKRLMDDAGQKVRLELRWGADALLHQHVMNLAASICISNGANGLSMTEVAEQIYRNLIDDLNAQKEYKMPAEVVLREKLIMRVPPLRFDVSKKEAE